MLDHTWTRDAVRRLRGHPVHGVQIPRHRAFSPGPAHGPGPLLRGVPRAPSHAYHHMGGIDRKRKLRRRLLQAAQGRPKKNPTQQRQLHRRQRARPRPRARPRQRQRESQRQREKPKQRKPKERKSKEREAQGVQPRAKAMAVQQRARPSAKTTTRPLQGAIAPSRRKGWAKERR